MDWAGCEFVEQVPGRMAGVPVITETRVTPETVTEHAAGGFSVGEIAWMFSIPRRKVRGILEYVRRQQRIAA